MERALLFTSYEMDDIRGFDRTHVFTLELLFGRAKRYLSDADGVTDALLGGWNFRGITTAETGLLFSPALGNNSNLNSDVTTFNPAACAAPGLYQLGTASNNSLRGPAFFEADWSLDNEFVFAEKYRLEFRWEVSDAINRTSLGLPVAAIDNGAGGIIQEVASPMRTMQFGLHLTF